MKRTRKICSGRSSIINRTLFLETSIHMFIYLFIYKVNVDIHLYTHLFIYLFIYSALLYGGKGDTMKIPYDTLPSSKKDRASFHGHPVSRLYTRYLPTNSPPLLFVHTGHYFFFLSLNFYSYLFLARNYVLQIHKDGRRKARIDRFFKDRFSLSRPLPVSFIFSFRFLQPVASMDHERTNKDRQRFLI